MTLRGMSDIIPGPECEPHPDEYQSEQVPEALWHDVVTVENDHYEDTEKCQACGKADRLVWPIEHCPAKHLPSEREIQIDARATAARQDTAQTTLASDRALSVERSQESKRDSGQEVHS